MNAIMKSLPALIFLASVLLASCSKESLPEAYGVYSERNGNFSRLNTTQTTILGAEARFLVFDNQLASGIVSPANVIRVLQRLYIRKNVEHICPSSDAPPVRIRVSDAGEFGAFGNPVSLSFVPVQERPGMIRIIPSEHLQAGLYYLEYHDQRFPFTVNVPLEEQTSNKFAVDKHYITIDRSAPFSWDTWLTLIQRRPHETKTYGGNTILKTVYQPTEVLTQIGNELEKQAQAAIERNHFSVAIPKVESHESIDPNDFSLRKQLSAALRQAANSAFGGSDWAAAILYIDVAKAIDPASASSLPSRERALEELTRSDDPAGRLAASKKDSKVLWQSGEGEQVRAVPEEAVSTEFRITDVGLVGTFLGGNNRRQNEYKLWFGDLEGFEKDDVRARLAFLRYSDPRPAIRIRTARGGDWLLVFISDARRNDCLKILATAYEEWKDATTLGSVSVSCDAPGRINYTITAFSRVWSPPVTLSRSLSIYRMNSSYGFNLRNASTKVLIETDGKVVPTGVPLQFMNPASYESRVQLEMGLP
jgi:hypothetical protein